MPSTASAETKSVTQIITITATVLPARSIVVNDRGQMTKIYSNTDQDVTPKVYVNKAPGELGVMTPELQKQYDSIMAKTKQKVGVAIDVPIPTATRLEGRLSKLLSNTISIATKPQILNW